MAGVDTWTVPEDWLTGSGLSETKLHNNLRNNLTVMRKVVEGDVSSQWNHQHAYGTFADRPAAGKPNRTYFATDFGVVFLDDGNIWHPVSYVDHLCEHVFEDFIRNITTANADDYPYWRVTKNSSATIGHSSDGTYSSAKINLGTDNSVRSAIQYRSVNNFCDLSERVPAIFEVRLRQTGTSGRIVVGFWDALPAALTEPTAGFYVREWTGATNYWQAGVRDASGSVFRDTGNQDTKYHTFRFEVFSTSLVKVYWENAGTWAQIGADITTNIPLVALRPGIYITQDTVDDSGVQVDYWRWLNARKMGGP